MKEEPCVLHGPVPSPDTWVSSFKPKAGTSSMGAFPKRVKIVEVGPRDGLQNEKVKTEVGSGKMVHVSVWSIPGKLGQVHYGLLRNWNIMQLLIQEY